MCLLTRDAFQLLCISPAVLEIKEEKSCLESQGVHPAAQRVDLSKQLALEIGARIGTKGCWGSRINRTQRETSCIIMC